MTLEDFQGCMGTLATAMSLPVETLAHGLTKSYSARELGVPSFAIIIYNYK